MPELALFCSNCHAPLCDGVEMVTDEFCSECYVNVACPAQCDLDHDVALMVPRGARRSLMPGSIPGTWDCPISGETFHFIGENVEAEWADVANWYPGDNWGSGSFLHNGTWYEDQADAGFNACESCEGWFDPESSSWYNGGDYMCASCYDNSREDEWYEDEDGYAEPDFSGPNRGYNAGCQAERDDHGEVVTHWNPMTEEVFGPQMAALQAPGTVFPIPSINDLEMAA